MRIMIFGDSNSWGYLDDGSGMRYAQRWPIVMKAGLESAGHGPVELVEECLPGRTSAYPDPQEGPEYNGQPYLRPALLSHAPLDWVLIMLGTNDCKTRFDASSRDIAGHIAHLARSAARAPVGTGKWREAKAPQVAVICPANLGARADDPSWPRFEEWLGAREKLSHLPDNLEQALARTDIPLLKAGDAVTPSMRDPIHLDENSHQALGAHIAACLAGLL